MKKTLLLSILAAFSLVAQAQLSENFNTTCASASFPSNGWTQYIPPTISIPPAGRWDCTAIKGRPTSTGVQTPGMTCTGTYSSAYNLDTSYLITPLISLPTASYPGHHAYLRFDTKKDDIILGGKLAVGEFIDTNTHMMNTILDTAVSGLITPAFGNSDSTNWVTHQADLSGYIGGNFYIAFRYTSTTTTGTAWYIDNVVLTSSSLEVSKIDKDILPISIIGSGSYSQIALSYTAHTSGLYRIVIYDMVGRLVYDGSVEATPGTESYVIKGLDLHPGMYCIKMGNDNTYCTTKVMIQ